MTDALLAGVLGALVVVVVWLVKQTEALRKEVSAVRVKLAQLTLQRIHTEDDEDGDGPEPNRTKRHLRLYVSGSAALIAWLAHRMREAYTAHKPVALTAGAATAVSAAIAITVIAPWDDDRKSAGPPAPVPSVSEPTGGPTSGPPGSDKEGTDGTHRDNKRTAGGAGGTGPMIENPIVESPGSGATTPPADNPPDGGTATPGEPGPDDPAPEPPPDEPGPEPPPGDTPPDEPAPPDEPGPPAEPPPEEDRGGLCIDVALSPILDADVCLLQGLI